MTGYRLPRPSVESVCLLTVKQHEVFHFSSRQEHAGRITFEFAEQWKPLVIADDVNVRFL